MASPKLVQPQRSTKLLYVLCVMCSYEEFFSSFEVLDPAMAAKQRELRVKTAEKRNFKRLKSSGSGSLSPRGVGPEKLTTLTAGTAAAAVVAAKAATAPAAAAQTAASASAVKK